ncbi:hypothetical protein CKAH01_11004 [Colletotrichum kahawae]|uniref:Uncharacterized protein n=1 Tax=Colletotrichum kahawae TaxID=34407 RepID=A0AAE0CWQ5_COLKA|nr:hypothetical protein CKAH01_11004 [Colletotrichum kahawae]
MPTLLRRLHPPPPPPTPTPPNPRTLSACSLPFLLCIPLDSPVSWPSLFHLHHGMCDLVDTALCPPLTSASYCRPIPLPSACLPCSLPSLLPADLHAKRSPSPNVLPRRLRRPTALDSVTAPAPKLVPSNQRGRLG